ncbi:GTPase [Actimicrobium sp. CCI2.3]|uniref:GTPase n=1 Tax=Actimicrobium sp. CCI2.3 TaxID=3048616 RepID=UPI002AB59EA2|nr:GTPase [Actimicrobium sp. CCI2.3]MDY7576504.1 GTPase [Actimicrobium sp. CCI2.3]MEB0021518.1 GTPase [Actimicrobium sp. CCI2.3]
MTPTALISGATARQREAVIADAIARLPLHSQVAVILEGMPDSASALADLPPDHALSITRIAPGCPCCIGNLTMRVTLNRALRHPPDYLFISLASTAHLEQTNHFLTSAPYDTHLRLDTDIRCPTIDFA